MTYQNYLNADEILTKNTCLIDAMCPQSESAVINAEVMLNLKFPKSYREFLIKYGFLDMLGAEIYGLDDSSKHKDKYIYYNIICNTLDERKINEDPQFPQSFVVVYDLGNGEKFCLDTAKMNAEGECPIVCWSFGNIESIEHEFGKDFGDFFFKVVDKSLKRAVEQGLSITI